MLLKTKTDTKNGVPNLEIQKLLDRDPYLADHEKEIKRRFGEFKKFVSDINSREGGIELFALGHKKFGFQVRPNNDILVRYSIVIIIFMTSQILFVLKMKCSSICVNVLQFGENF